MVICSRNGYWPNGKYRISGKEDDVFDIIDNGKIVGEITSKQLKNYLKRCSQAGRKSKYTNIRNDTYVIDPNYEVQQIQYVFGVDRSGDFFVREPESVVGGKSQMGDKSHYSFELQNGFVIGVHAFKINELGKDFSSVEFTIFGVRETFGLVDGFTLVFCVSKYTSDTVGGSIYVEEMYENRDSSTKLGDFTLSKSGTLYKGEYTNVVYDSARFSKELIRG